METLIDVLHLEDNPADAKLVQAKLEKDGLACRITRVQTRDEFETALREGGADIILADYQLPMYDGISALRLTLELCPDIPFIFVSGTMGEENAIEGLTQGATDYVLKQRLMRLGSAVKRALQEARTRRERRQAYEEAQRSSEMLRAIIEAAPVAIIGLDLEGRVQSVWNPAAEKMLGWRAQNVKGQPLPSVPVERQEEFSRFREQIRSGLTLDGVEVRWQKRDGTPTDFSAYASPLYDAQGRICGNMAVLVDITERKRAEEALKASEARYIDLYDNAPDMYVSVNAKTASIEKCNQTLADTLGYPKAEIIGRAVFEIYHPDCLAEAKAAFQEFLQRGEIHDKELQLRKKDGSKLNVSLNVSAVRAKDGTILFSRSTLRDITEQRRNRMINAARMHLMQFAVAHSLDELLEESVTKAEKVTDSLIGFYHFVDDNQQELTLQNWSARTKAQFCRARGKGMHYPIADAGVWVDCVHQRRPVIHNDYMSLSHRKGLPEGHADVVRELVVPVVRGEKIKAILGVGNKPADYSENDVEAMSLLADLAWEITERKQTEQQVALMSFAMNGIHEAAFMIDEKARFQYVNEEACRLLGYSRDELLSKTVMDVNPETSLKSWPGHWRDLKEHGTLTFEGQLKARDGRFIPVEVNANYFEYEGRSFDLGLVRDITERKQAEIRLNEQLHFLQQLIDSIPIPIYYKDPQGLYLGCNAAFEAFNGLPRKNIVGKTVYEVVPKERADKHHELDLALLRQPGEQTYELGGIYKDGKHHDVIYNKAAFFDAQDCVAGTVGTLIDITERKQAERERLANLRFFESMDKVNRAIQKADSLEQMMKDALDVVISILDCERVYLLHPCDPEAEFWTVPMECSKPGYAGSVYTQKLKMPMISSMAEMLRVLMEAEGPLKFGPGTDQPLPAHVWERYGFKSMIAMAIHPKVGKAWQFGIHQCSYARTWTPEEEMLVREIGRRLGDALSSLLSYRELLKNEEFLDSVVEHIPNMIFVKDAQTHRYIRFNRSGELLMGYPRQELLGKTDHDFFSKEIADWFTAGDRQAIESKALVDIPEETIRNRNNEERVLHTRKIPILDENGTPQYLLGISEDITERKQAEEAIRLLSQAVEQSPVSIVITDALGAIEFVNDKFTQITGYSRAEALGQNPRILKSGDMPAGAYRHLWKTISSGGVWRGEFHNRKKNGDLFWEQATIAPVRNADNVITHYVAVKEDITEYKKLEAQYHQAQKMEAVGQLAGGVAHDFNNMLGVIMGHTELALDVVDPAQPIFSDLQEIRIAAERSANLTRQLLAFARKQTIIPKVLDLNETIEGMLKMLRRLIGEDIDLAWLPGSRVWPLKVDPSQVDQILANLCVNARDAISGGGRLTIETQNVTLDEDYCADHRGFIPGQYALLAVSDDGCGMDQETLSKIFEPFFTTKEMGKGTGLGLATVYGIVKQNKGFINVYSEPEKGTTFKIYLPRHMAAAGDEPKAIREAPAPGGNETILVVEDEPSILNLAKAMLERLGYRVLAALTPDEAIASASEHDGEIHLLLTDLIMPGMNGRELAERLVSLHPEILCLYMSGYPGSVIAHQSVLDEGLHFLQKPFTKYDLAAKVREVLEGK